MAPKGKSRKLKTVKIVEEKEEGDDDNNEVEEKADEAVEKDDEDFTMEEVLRWGGTKVRKRVIPVTMYS